MGFAGLGAVGAAIYLASRTSVRGLGKLIPVSAVLFGSGLVFMGLSRNFHVSLAIMVLCGFGMLALMGSCNTLLQTIVDDDKRGRVLSIYIMAFRGVVPFGSLLLGALAARIGTQHTLIVGGSAAILGAYLFARYIPVMRKHTPENIY
jgi:MFS family permease